MAAPKKQPDAAPAAPKEKAKRTPRAARGKSDQSIDGSDGRAYVHIDIFSIGYGDFEVDQNSDGVEVSDDERTWSFPAPQEVIDRLVRDQEFVSTHSAGVPLTRDEERAAADLEQRARIEGGKFAEALVAMAREKAAAGED